MCFILLQNIKRINMLEKKSIIEIFKALSEPTRFEIVFLLREGETCACDLLDSLRISQPTLSHHMKILTNSGVVICRREKTWSFYKLNDRKINEIRTILSELSNSKYKYC